MSPISFPFIVLLASTVLARNVEFWLSMSNSSLHFISRLTSSERPQDAVDAGPSLRRLENLILADALLAAEPSLFDVGEPEPAVSAALEAGKGTL